MSTCAERLVGHFKGRKETMEAFGISRETLRLWLRDGVPLEKALVVEEKSAGAVTAGEVLEEERRRRQATRNERAADAQSAAM